MLWVLNGAEKRDGGGIRESIGFKRGNPVFAAGFSGARVALHGATTAHCMALALRQALES